MDCIYTELKDLKESYELLEKENEALKEELKREKFANQEIKKRLVEVEYECQSFNHEYCDPNCSGKVKQVIDLYQLVSDGLNETLLKQRDAEVDELKKQIWQLQNELAKMKENLS